MLKVALTGGIGSGKSAASSKFEKLGIEVIDADIISHDLVEPGQPALRKITNTFGREMLLADGRLDRKRLRNTIFANPQARRQLEGILHPLIYQKMHQRLEQVESPYAVMVIPLLTESKENYEIDRILLIDVPESVQAQRVIHRDNCSHDEFEQILASQASREERLRTADDIILNDGTLEQLHLSVEEQHQQYLAMSKQ